MHIFLIFLPRKPCRPFLCQQLFSSHYLSVKTMENNLAPWIKQTKSKRSGQRLARVQMKPKNAEWLHAKWNMNKYIFFIANSGKIPTVAMWPSDARGWLHRSEIRPYVTEQFGAPNREVNRLENSDYTAYLPLKKGLICLERSVAPKFMQPSVWLDFACRFDCLWTGEAMEFNVALDGRGRSTANNLLDLWVQQVGHASDASWFNWCCWFESPVDVAQVPLVFFSARWKEPFRCNHSVAWEVGKQLGALPRYHEGVLL